MNQLKLWVVIITLSITVASSFIAIKIVLDSISPLFAFSIRFMITGSILILISYLFDRKNREIRDQALEKCFGYWCNPHSWRTRIDSLGNTIPLSRYCLFTKFNNSLMGSIIYVLDISQ